MNILKTVGAVLLVIAFPVGTAHAHGHDHPKTVEVNCGKGETIQHALDHHAEPGRSLVVIVKGTCNENVTITADDVTLKGDPAVGATVNGPAPNLNTILVDAARRVVIDNLIVTGARNGVVADNSASVTVMNVRAQNNAQSGIVSIAGGRVSVDACEARHNGADGILVTDNASGFVTNCTIEDNGLDGVNLSNGSNATLYGNTVQGNGRDGVNVGRSSLRLVGANAIRSNAVRGVSVSQGALFQGPGDFSFPPAADVIEANGDAGLGVFQGGSADVRLALIQNNAARGINLNNSGSLRIENSTVIGNTGDGVGVFNGSSAFIVAPMVTITGNTGNGVNLFDGATADIQFASITANGLRGVVATTGAKLRLLGTTVSHHPNDGVAALDGATLLLQCTFAPFPTCAAGSTSTISQNITGVSVATGSTGVLQGVTISNNTGTGVRADTNATLRLQTPATAITANTGNGVHLSHHAIANFNSPPAAVTGNGGSAILCTGAPSVLIGNTSGAVGPVTGCPPVFP